MQSLLITASRITWWSEGLKNARRPEDTFHIRRLNLAIGFSLPFSFAVPTKA
jgi:hypothetical protein